MALTRLLRPLHRPSLRYLSSFSPPPPDGDPAPAPKPPVSRLKAAINSIFKERDLDRLVARFKDSSAFPHFRRRHSVYSVAVRRLALHGRLDGVEEILEALKRYPSDIAREGFAARIIHLYGKAGMADHAERTFGELPSLGCPRTLMSFNALLSAFVSAGKADRAVEHFQGLPSEHPDIVPDVFSYNILIHAMCEMGQVDSALSVVRLMEEMGVNPNLITFNTLLRAFYQNHRFEEAGRIWTKLAEKNLEPDLRSFNERMIGLVAQEKTSEALELVEEMRSRGMKLNTYSFNALITGHCKDGNLEEAKKVLVEMKQNMCLPNAGTFEALIPKICEAGELDFAFSLCKKSIAHLVDVKVLQGVVGDLANASRLDDAKKLVELGWTRSCYKESLKMPLPCLAM